MSAAEKLPSVLVVEDSTTTRLLLEKTMSSLGFQVDTAAHGEEALDHLDHRGAYDLALVDWNMPVMNGLSLLSALDGRHEWKSMKILMISTNSELDEMVEALQLGATDYLTKPFSKSDLMEKLFTLGFSA